MGLAALHERVARAIYEERGPKVLQPGQWSALRFFERAGGEARTVTALSKYLGVTLGPASRAAAALERRGLISPSPNPKDRRGLIFELTEQGRAQLAKDPLKRFASALGAADDTDREAFSRVLFHLFDELDTTKGRV
ncbi:hypothetical protein KIN_12530 [Litoreibacter roseus]|uniref:HTH marR-type domain-containing protein n=1 Tax=Litoreibacter roseus TaxID=2601869 RepID=A0A6N6JFL5_9RHOB|nr:hypothetical protein KIN_12530 [Litoreibacter roseus]